MSFYQQDTKEVFEKVSSSQAGLSSHEAQKRLHQYGENVLTVEKKLSVLRMFLEQFVDPLVWVLLGAAVISLFIDNVIDAFVIFAILLFNALFGLFQEYKAEKSILLLQKLRQYRSRVLRDGKDMLIDSAKLVQGDIHFLSEGDKVPADGRLLSVERRALADGDRHDLGSSVVGCYLVSATSG